MNHLISYVASSNICVPLWEVFIPATNFLRLELSCIVSDCLLLAEKEQQHT